MALESMTARQTARAQAAPTPQLRARLQRRPIATGLALTRATGAVAAAMMTALPIVPPIAPLTAPTATPTGRGRGRGAASGSGGTGAAALADRLLAAVAACLPPSAAPLQLQLRGRPPRTRTPASMRLRLRKLGRCETSPVPSPWPSLTSSVPTWQRWLSHRCGRAPARQRCRRWLAQVWPPSWEPPRPRLPQAQLQRREQR